MGQISYDVPMRRQEQNPICWIACMAMIASFKSQSSQGIGNFTGGFDPSNSSILNPARNWDDMYLRMNSFGFTSVNLNASPAPAYVESLLNDHGPFILSHLVSQISYGSQYATFQAGVVATDPNAAHAVVITGINTDNGIATMNNPWGDKDQTLTLNSILMSMQVLFTQGKRPAAYMR